MEQLHFILRDGVVFFIGSNKLNTAIKGDILITIDRSKAVGSDIYNSPQTFQDQLTQWLVNGHKKPIYVVGKNKVY